jgi:prolyl 4-hydroxylase
MMQKTAAGSAVVVLVLALFWGSWVQSYLPTWKGVWGGVRKEEFVCQAGSYTTEIVSIDPLLIYINNFVDESEIKGLIAEGSVFSSIPPLLWLPF